MVGVDAEVRDDHKTETNVEPVYWCNIGASESWVNTIKTYTTCAINPLLTPILK